MDIKQINAIFDEIGTFNIDLSGDPTILGPQYLNQLIATCRNYLNRTASILLKIAQEKVVTENQLEAEKAAYAIAFNELLASDERIQKAPNIRDREAMIEMLLQDRRRNITAFETAVRNLNSMEKAVRVRHNELIRTDGQIKTQRSLIRDELDTKSYMGDEHNDRSTKGSIDEDELNDLMGDIPATPKESDTPQGNSATLFTLPSVQTPKSEEVEDLQDLVAPALADPEVSVKISIEPVRVPKATVPVEEEPIADALAIVAALEADAAPEALQEAPAVSKENGTDSDAIESFLKDGPSAPPSTGALKVAKKSKKDKVPAKEDSASVEEMLITQKSTSDEASEFDDILKSL